MRLYALWAALCALVPLRAAAEDGFLLEPTYALPAPLFLRGGRSVADESPTHVPYTLEASISPHLPMTTNLDELALRDGFAHAIIFVPRVDLRHGRAESYPIRTPSYYPTLHFQLFHQTRSAALVRRVVAELLVAHHSNGQDGCLYREQTQGDDGCRADGPARLHVNHKDGSFATNELGLRLGGSLGRGSDALREVVYGQLGVVAFRPHSLGLDPELARSYGKLRLEAQLRLERERGVGSPRARRFALQLRTTLRLGGAHVQSPLALRVDLTSSFRRAFGWGPFVRLHAGSDDYNVRYDVRVLVLGLGLMWQG